MVATSILPSEARRDIETRSHVITSTGDSERLAASTPETRDSIRDSKPGMEATLSLKSSRLKARSFVPANATLPRNFTLRVY